MTATAGHATSARRFLTIILTGRNDNFGGDFNTRLFRALAFNHRHLVEANVDYEIVFVEWRPLSGREYLAQLLRRECPGLALTAYVVDPRYHAAFSQNSRVQFQEFIAKNVGIQRAQGSFILTTNTDIYLGRDVIDRLAARDLRAGVLYRAMRIDLKSGADTSHFDWAVLEDSRNYAAVNTIRPPYYTNASGDFLLLDRETYHHLRGFNEVYRVAKVHMDSNFCLKAHAVGIPIEDVHGPVYHVGLGTLNAMAASYRNRPGEAPWGDIRWKNGILYENPGSWGLSDAPSRPIDVNTFYLDFDRRAVPPVVDLRGVRERSQYAHQQSDRSGMTR